MDIIDFKKVFESRVRSTSNFSEILDAFEAVARIPVETEYETLMFQASRNYTASEDFIGQPLFGSFSNYSKKSFCIELERAYDLMPPQNDVIDFRVIICFPSELWNLGLVNGHVGDQGVDEFIQTVIKTKTYRYLLSHECKPDFVHVIFGKAE